MGAIENEKVYGLTIRESADDGSDFTNPDADYRRLFLGEDGQLHVKDSAGTVSGIGGSIADILDIPTAEDDDTLVLAPDGAGGVEFRAEAGGTFDPDEHMPWHVDIIPTVTPRDYADVGTWGVSYNNGSFDIYPYGATDGEPTLLLITSSHNQNDEVSWKVSLSAGTWTITLFGRKFNVGGIVTIEVDDSDVGTIDTYAASDAALKDSVTSVAVATSGTHKITLAVKSKHASSTNYYLVLSHIHFQRTA